jgi:hypothetical protein
VGSVETAARQWGAARWAAGLAAGQGWVADDSGRGARAAAESEEVGQVEELDRS